MDRHRRDGSQHVQTSTQGQLPTHCLQPHPRKGQTFAITRRTLGRTPKTGILGRCAVPYAGISEGCLGDVPGVEWSAASYEERVNIGLSSAYLVDHTTSQPKLAL